MQNIFIHAGFHKTGSTSIQYYLKKNEKKLKDLNIYIPKTGQGFKEWINHSLIAHSLLNYSVCHKYLVDLLVEEYLPPSLIFLPLINQLNIYDTPSNLVDLLVEEISKREEDILLSSEDFSHLFSNKKLLNTFINKFEVKKYKIIFIFFNRNDLNYLPSLYIQLKTGFCTIIRSEVGTYFNFFLSNLIFGQYKIKKLGLSFLTSGNSNFPKKLGLTYFIINYNKNKGDLLSPFMKIILQSTKKVYPTEALEHHNVSNFNTKHFSKNYFFWIINFIFFLKKNFSSYFNKQAN